MWFLRRVFPHNRKREQIDEPPKGQRQLRFSERQDQKRAFLVLLRRVFLIGGFVFLLLVGRVIWSRFTVRTVTCELEGEPCDTQLQEEARKLHGKSMFSSLHMSHPYLSVSIRRHWPDQVVVIFKRPDLLLTFQSLEVGKPMYSLSTQGFIVSFTRENAHLPQVFDHSLENQPIGTRVDEKTLALYTYLVSKAPQDIYTHITKITREDEDTIYFDTDSKGRVIADTAGIAAELLSLQALFSSPTIDRTGKTIDLRFDNPVLK